MEQAETLPAKSSSIPILDMADSISLVPLIGILDSTRSQALMEDVLESIKRDEKTIIIIDILGILTIDSAVAAHLIKLSNATRLMGCEMIISGISPEIAQTIVNLGISLQGVQTTGNLKNAILFAYEKVGLQLIRTAHE